MTTPTHIITGIAIGAVATQFTEVNQYLVISISAFLNVLPDLNLIWEKDILKHHDDITHYPVFLLITTTLFVILEKVFTGNIFWGALLILNLFIHLIMDTFGVRIGIHWLWPASKREFSFTKLHPKDDLNWRGHLKLFNSSKHLYIEGLWIGICVFGVLVILLWIPN